MKEAEAGSLQFEQGKSASDWFRVRTEERLKRSNGKRRNLLVQTSEAPFDNYHRVLAYAAPS